MLHGVLRRFAAFSLAAACGMIGAGGLSGGTFFSENFDAFADDAAVDAAGWQRIDAGGATETATWTITNPGLRRNPPTADGTPSTGKFIISDSDAAGGDDNVPGTGMSHDLWTPSFSTAGSSVVWLHVDCVAQLNNDADAIFDIEVSTDDGALWTNVFHRVSPGRVAPPASDNSNADGFFGRLELDLSTLAANQASVRLRFRHFEPTDDWFIAIDELLVDDAAPTQGGTRVLLADQDFSAGFGSLSATSKIAPLPNSGTETWHLTDKGNRYVAGATSGHGLNRLNHPNPLKEFVIMDSDADPDPPEDEYLQTPVLNCASFSEVYLHFRSETILDDAATQEVLLSLDGGATFSSRVFTYNQAGGANNALFDGGEDPFYGEFVLSVPAAAGQSKVVFAFHYQSPGDRWWWALDDIKVTGTKGLPAGVFLSENFDDFSTDAEIDGLGWQRIDANGATETATWTITNPGLRRNPPTANGTPSTGQFMISDSDAAGGDDNTVGTGMSHDLWTPSFSTLGAATVWLHASCTAQLNNGADAIFDVEVSTDGGGVWNNVFHRVSPGRTTPPVSDTTNADGFFGQLNLDLSAAAGNQASVRLRFRHYEPTDDWFIALDDIQVDNKPPVQPVSCELLPNQGFASGLGAMRALSRVNPANTGNETWSTGDKGGRYVAGTVSGRGVNRLNHPNPLKEFVILESSANPDPVEDEYLMTPVLNCATYSEVFLQYKSETLLADAATQEVLLSLDGGVTFPIPIFTFNKAGGANNALFDDGEEPFYGEFVFKVGAAAGQSKVVFAFHYQSPGNQQFWALDDIRVTATTENCDPRGCALRSLSQAYNPATHSVTGNWGGLFGDEGFRVFQGDRQIGGDLPASATSFADDAPPVDGAGVVYTLQSIVGGQVERECPFQPVDTYTCQAGLTCRPDQVGKKVSLEWSLGTNLGVTGFQIVRNGETIETLAATATSFVDAALPPAALAVPQHLVLNYQLVPVGSSACPPLSCRAVVSTGIIHFADDFEDYPDDVQLEFGGWFRVDVIKTPPGEAATWTVTNPGGRGNPPTFDGKPSAGRFAISDSDFADGDNGDAAGSGNSNDLWSPAFSTRNQSAVWLHLDASVQMNNNGRVVFDVDVSTNGGVAWTNLFRRVAPSRPPKDPLLTVDNADGYFGRLDVDLSSIAADKAQVQFRVRSFEPSDDWWIAIDNVIVDNVPPPAGGTVTIFEEDFSSGLGEMSVDSVAGNSGAQTWDTSDRGHRSVIDFNGGNFPYLDGRGVHRLGSDFAILEAETAPVPAQLDEYLLTPILDCRGYAEVFLHYLSEIVVTDQTVEEVLVSFDGGATFEPPLFAYNNGGLYDDGEEPFFASRVIKLDGAAGKSQVQVAFHYQAAGGRRYWAIDDVKVTATPIPPPCEVTGVTCGLDDGGLAVTWSIASSPDCGCDHLRIENGAGTLLATPAPTATAAHLAGDCAALLGGSSGTIKVVCVGADGSTRSGSCSLQCGGRQLPGDFTQDKLLDVSDPIAILNRLFLGQGQFPCEGGVEGPGNVSLIDFDGNGSIDISDALGNLNFQFIGSSPPPLGRVCLPIAGCPDICQ